MKSLAMALVLSCIIFSGCGNSSVNGSPAAIESLSGTADRSQGQLVDLGSIYADAWMSEEWDRLRACTASSPEYRLIAYPLYELYDGPAGCPEDPGVACVDHAFVDVGRDVVAFEIGWEHDVKTFDLVALHQLFQNAGPVDMSCAAK